MSMRTRQMDTLQRIMTSFKHFEKKLDKLQEDVSFHGQTLSELRAIVTNLSAGTILNPDIKTEDVKQPSKKTTAIQYDDHALTEETLKTKRKNTIQPLPTKLKASSLQNPKSAGILTSPDSPFPINKVPSNSKGINQTGKHSKRPRKAEAPRKATTLRVQKGTEKKRSKILQ